MPAAADTKAPAPADAKNAADAKAMADARAADQQRVAAETKAAADDKARIAAARAQRPFRVVPDDDKKPWPETQSKPVPPGVAAAGSPYDLTINAPTDPNHPLVVEAELTPGGARPAADAGVEAEKAVADEDGNMPEAREISEDDADDRARSDGMVKMLRRGTNGEEISYVHPTTVHAHRSVGWTRADEYPDANR
jgi:hypothetical protein